MSRRKEAEEAQARFDERRRQLAAIEERKRRTGYDGFGHHALGVQSVCQMCFAVVTDEAGHTAWHRLLGQEWGS